MGLAFLLVILLYFALLIGATVGGYRFGKKRGWSVGRRRLAATGAFFVILMPVFWDWLPTVWLHSYYCEKYAGLSVYRTPDQWKQANLGIAETLVPQKPPVQVGHGDKYYRPLNQRFRLEIEDTEKLLWLREHQERVVDGKTGEILVRFVEFHTGQSRRFRSFRDYKAWMYRGSCEPEGQYVNRRKFGELSQAFENLGGQR